MNFESIIDANFDTNDRKRIEVDARREIMGQLHETLSVISASFPRDDRAKICARGYQDGSDEVVLATAYNFRTEPQPMFDDSSGEVADTSMVLHFREWSAGTVVDINQVRLGADQPEILPLAQLTVEDRTLTISDYDCDDQLPRHADMYEIGEYNRIIEQAFSERE